jgi:hypothetical protein
MDVPGLGMELWDEHGWPSGLIPEYLQIAKKAKTIEYTFCSSLNQPRK